MRWGFLTASRIANKWANALNLLTGEADLIAVASRDTEKAASFAAQHGVSEVADDYRSLVTRDDIDVVYVSSPHSHHLEHALLAIEAGKPVLVEKPATPTMGDSLRLIEAAADRGVFLMEAMWTRCNPIILQARDLISRGVLGDPRLFQASYPVRFVAPDEHRIFNPDLAGGAILDLGVYPAHLAHALLGRPDRVGAFGTLTHTGVDNTSVAELTWQSSKGTCLGTLVTSLEGEGLQRLELVGTAGTLAIENFVKPDRMTFTPHGGQPQQFVTSYPPGGYTFQAQEVHRSLRLGRTESELVPWQSTLDVAWLLEHWIDGVRRSADDSHPDTASEDDA